MAWKPEVFVQGEWSRNTLVFATEKEATDYARDLHWRWTLCRDYRAVQVEAEVTHEWSESEGLGPVGGKKSFPPERVQL